MTHTPAPVAVDRKVATPSAETLAYTGFDRVTSTLLLIGAGFAVAAGTAAIIIVRRRARRA